MTIKTLFFCIATLMPLPLLILGVVDGGLWSLIAFTYMTGFAVICDEWFELDFPTDQGSWFAKQVLPILIGVGHLVMLPIAIYTIAVSDLNSFIKLVMFYAFGLYFGTIGHANAHELIHRNNPLHFNLGKWMFISMLFGHHTSAHILVHHPNVSTPKDPNTALFNESFYKFIRRVSIGEFKSGLIAERKKLKNKDTQLTHLRNPYYQYVAGGILFIVLAYVIAGLYGILTYLGFCVFSQLQMLMTDYVQHYGLIRQQLENGRYEPISKQHSWNAPHWFSSLMTLNAPRHSDHHMSARKPYTDLLMHRETAPQLPHSIPFMAIIALWPKKWRAIMNPRVQQWQSKQTRN